MGALYLALLVVSVWSVSIASRQALRVAGGAWLVFSVPHLIFHMFHLDMYGLADKAGNAAALGGTVLLAAILLLRTRERGHRAQAAHQSATEALLHFKKD